MLAVVVGRLRKAVGNVRDFSSSLTSAIIFAAVLSLSAGTLLVIEPDAKNDYLVFESGSAVELQPIQTLRPQEVSARIQVADGTNVGGGSVVDFGGIQIYIDGAAMRVFAATPFGPKEEIAVFPSCQNCEILLGPGPGVTVASNNDGVSLRSTVLPDGLDFGQFVTAVSISDPPEVLTVEIDFGLGGLEQPIARIILMLFGLGALGVLLGRSILLPRMSAIDVAPKRSDRALFALVLLAQVGAAILIPAQADEGWVQARSEAFILRGFLGNIYTVGDGLHPQGLIYESLLALVLLFGADHIHLRLIAAAFNVLTWVFISISVRLLLKELELSTSMALPIAGALYVSLSVIWLSNIRSEVPVLLLLSISFYFIVRVAVEKEIRNLIPLAIISGIAVTTHQSASVFIPVILSLPLLLIALRNFTLGGKSVSRQRVLVETLLSGVIFSAVVVFVSTFLTGGALFWDQLGLWAIQSTHGEFGTLTSEFTRLERVFERRPGGFLLLIGLGLLPLVCVLLFTRLSQRPELFIVLLGVALSPVGLLLTGSKWDWHYAVLILPSVLGVGLFAASAVGQGRKMWANRGEIREDSKHPNETIKSHTRFVEIWLNPITLASLSALTAAAFLGLGWVHRRPDTAPFSEISDIWTGVRWLIDNVNKSTNLQFEIPFFPGVTVVSLGVLAVSFLLSFMGWRRTTGVLLAGLLGSSGMFLLISYSGSGLQSYRSGIWTETEDRLSDLGLGLGGACSQFGDYLAVTSVRELSSGQRILFSDLARSATIVGEGAYHRSSDWPEKALPGLVGYWVYDPHNNLVKASVVVRGENSGSVNTGDLVNDASEGWRLVSVLVEEPVAVDVEIVSRGEVSVTDLYRLDTEPLANELRDAITFAGPKHYQYQGCGQTAQFGAAHIEGFAYRTEKTGLSNRDSSMWFQIVPGPSWFSLIYRFSN